MAAERGKARDVVIFVPGLTGEQQDMDTVARRFAGALERQSSRAETVFAVVGAPEVEYGRRYRSRVRTIEAREPDREKGRSRVDLYEFDYRDNLVRDFRRRTPLARGLVMFSVIVAVAPRFFLSLFRGGKGLRDQLQMLTMSGIMMAMVAYMVLMVGTGVVTLAQAPALAGLPVPGFVTRLLPAAASGEKRQTVGTTTAAAAAGVRQVTARLLPLAQAMIVVLAALGLFTRRSLKEVIATLAVQYVCAANYLRLASRKTAILGQAAALLEHLGERGYRRVHVVSYSFGTLVAMDVLFPHVQPAARLGLVHSLVTIGSPFDVVRTYWPAYFTGRHRLDGVPARWINLYAPLDVFGSNFRNDADPGPAEQGIGLGDRGDTLLPDVNIPWDVGIQTGRVNLLDILTVRGIRIHSSYWSGDEAPEVNCFDFVAGRLCEDDSPAGPVEHAGK